MLKVAVRGNVRPRAQHGQYSAGCSACPDAFRFISRIPPTLRLRHQQSSPNYVRRALGVICMLTTYPKNVAGNIPADVLRQIRKEVEDGKLQT